MGGSVLLGAAAGAGAGLEQMVGIGERVAAGVEIYGHRHPP